MMHTIYLPWPPKQLSPNGRLHWAAKAKAVKAYRRDCTYKAMADGLRKLDADSVHLTFTFFPPGNYHFDCDGLMARMKAGIDGLADLIGIDDRCFTYGAPQIKEAMKPGMVKVDISAGGAG